MVLPPAWSNRVPTNGCMCPPKKHILHAAGSTLRYVHIVIAYRDSTSSKGTSVFGLGFQGQNSSSSVLWLPFL